MEALELEEDLQPLSHKFEWINRPACVDTLVVLMDDGLKFDRAFRSIKLSDYAFNVSKMLVKQRNQLRKDTMQALKDMRYMRDSADVGDTVRVPRLVPGLLPGAHKRDGTRLVDAVIIQRTLISGHYRFTVRRLDDNGLQTGNSHMIKAVTLRVAAEHGN